VQYVVLLFGVWKSPAVCGCSMHVTAHVRHHAESFSITDAINH